jgi:ketosteroid isomerase-like protein
MHTNAGLLQRLFSSLNQHDHKTMAACYHSQATFTDIAFDLRGRQQIHAMWHMICQPGDHKSDIHAMFNVVRADDQRGWVNLVDDYTFSSTGRKVTNVIDSYFCFEEGLIVKQHDFCDARAWASMAVGGLSGLLAAQFHFLRSLKARQMLNKFVEKHSEYQLAFANRPTATKI